MPGNDIQRGDLLWAVDPFRDGDTGRPWVVIGTEDAPFSERQYICLSLSTKTWYEDRIPLDESDLLHGGCPEKSSILPWSVGSIAADDVEKTLGRVHKQTVDEAAEQLRSFIGV